MVWPSIHPEGWQYRWYRSDNFNPIGEQIPQVFLSLQDRSCPNVENAETSQTHAGHLADTDYSDHGGTGASWSTCG
jgi:hypothetical protein